MVWKEYFIRYQQEAIPENTKFWIILRSHDELAIKLAYVSTWAMIVLGSIGARHTRGAGSLMIKNIVPENFDLNLNFSFNDLESELPSEIDNAIYTCLLPILSQKWSLKQERKNGNTCLRYSALSPKCAKVYLWKKDVNEIYYKSNDKNHPQSLMDEFEKKFKSFEIPEKPHSGYEEYVFGLPKRGEHFKKRRTSPMHVGAIKTKEVTFLKIVTFRTSEFYPNFNGRVSWEVIDTFLNDELKADKIWGYVNK